MTLRTKLDAGLRKLMVIDQSKSLCTYLVRKISDHYEETYRFDTADYSKGIVLSNYHLMH